MKVRATESFQTTYETQFVEVFAGVELDSPFADFCVLAGHPVDVIEGELVHGDVRVAPADIVAGPEPAAAEAASEPSSQAPAESVAAVPEAVPAPEAVVAEAAPAEHSSTPNASEPVDASAVSPQDVPAAPAVEGSEQP